MSITISNMAKCILSGTLNAFNQNAFKEDCLHYLLPILLIMKQSLSMQQKYEIYFFLIRFFRKKQVKTSYDILKSQVMLKPAAFQLYKMDNSMGFCKSLMNALSITNLRDKFQLQRSASLRILYRQPSSDLQLYAWREFSGDQLLKKFLVNTMAYPSYFSWNWIKLKILVLISAAMILTDPKGAVYFDWV